MREEIITAYYEWANLPENYRFGFSDVNTSHIASLAEFILDKLNSTNHLHNPKL